MNAKTTKTTDGRTVPSLLDPPPAPTCATCRYWREDETLAIEPDVDVGECRRFPPRADDRVVTSEADDWCGEHRPADDR